MTAEGQRPLFDDAPSDAIDVGAGELELREVRADELAALLDVTPRRIRQLADDGVLSRAARGRYVLGPSVRGYARFLKGAKGGEGTKAESEAELKSYQAQLAALNLAQRRGELADVAEIRKKWLDIVSRAKVRLLAVPSRIGAQFNAVPHTPRGVAALAKSLIEEALRELADYDGRPIRGTSRKRVRPAEGSKRKRVGGRKSDTQSGGQRRAGTMAN